MNNTPQVNSNFNILSYNSTGWSDYKADFVNTLLIAHTIHVAVLQEHFQLKANLYKISRSFQKYKTFSLPAFKNNATVNRGRPSCGLSIIYSDELSSKVTHITVPDSFRVQAIKVNTPGLPYIFINCYFPTDPKINIFDETELYKTLQDLNYIFEKQGPNAKYILMGDINWDTNRDTRFVQIIRNYVTDRDLFPIWNLFQCDFTYSQSQLRNNRQHIYYSTIDHYIVSENTLDDCTIAMPLHLAENTSNHEPIYMKLKIDTIPTPNHNDASRKFTSKPAWNKAEDDNIASYFNELDARLAQITIPAPALRCNNVKCSDINHKVDVDIYMLEVLDAISQSVKNNIPHTKPAVTKRIIPGWKEFVKPYKDDARFWFAIWESAGRPQNNNLHLIMKNTKNKFNYMLRKVRKREKHLRNDRFITECLNGKVNNVLSEIKRSRQQNQVSSSMDGKSGSKNISDHFKNIYQELYNTHDDKDEILVINNRIESKINQSQDNILNKITPNLVSKIILRMKTGKNDVQYDWRSEAIKYANKIIAPILSVIFKFFLSHNHMSKPLLKSALVPIIKDSNLSHTASENYRAIAISSIIMKILDYVILELEPQAFNTSQYQFGFKAHTSTTLCSWAVTETTNYFTSRGGIIYSCFLDLKKAFDMIKLSLLFIKLEDKMSPILLRFIIFTYTNQSCCVRWNGCESDPFTTRNGVRQGASISPLLFALYIDDLFRRLEKSGLGCYINEQFMGAYGYADDIVIISPNKSGLQKMINICDDFCTEHGIKISCDENPKKSKTKTMVFNSKECQPANLLLRDIRVPWTDSYKHLGHHIFKDEDMVHDLNVKKGTFISNIHSLRQEFGQMNPEIFLRLTEIYNTSFYGSNIWDLGADSAEKLWSSWNVLLKSTFNLPYGTHRYISNGIYGKSHLKSRLMKRFLNFYHTIRDSDKHIINVLFTTQSDDVRSVFGRNCQLIKTTCGVNEITRSTRVNFPVYPIPHGEEWRIPVITELLLIRDNILTVDFLSCEDILTVDSLSCEDIQQLLNSLCCD